MRHGCVDSTMDLLHGLAVEGAEEGTAVLAEEQSAGRGSRGRTWRSPRGGLWLSVLLRPAGVATELVSLRVGLAAADAVERLGPALPLALKWPNDLMLGDRKLGGILCEARWSGDAPAWVAVGIGINVRNLIPLELQQTAVALQEVLPGVTPEVLLEAMLPRVRALDASRAALDSAELRRLAARDWLLGRRLSRPVEGWAEGIAADGALRVRRDTGSLTLVRAGSVELAQSTPAP